MDPENDNAGGDRRNNEDTGYAAARIKALGSMDIALLTANVNQLRLLRAYNSKASTFYISLALIILSLVIQVAVGIALIFRRRWRLYNRNPTRFVVCAVFMVTVINVLLMAFIETDGMDKSDKENENEKI